MMQADRTHFADPADRASHEEQLELERALAAARRRREAEKPLPDIGQCHNCEEPLTGGRRFCDDDCRDDFDHRMKRRKANGITLQ